MVRIYAQCAPRTRTQALRRRRHWLIAASTIDWSNCAHSCIINYRCKIRILTCRSRGLACPSVCPSVLYGLITGQLYRAGNPYVASTFGKIEWPVWSDMCAITQQKGSKVKMIGRLKLQENGAYLAPACLAYVWLADCAVNCAGGENSKVEDILYTSVSFRNKSRHQNVID